ncbi:kynurenine formamidase [Nocardioides zeae]|uniref:Kynurenine formamidase n=1 Tax=Nocardioides zeae TaxID=1457234 RepID=A0ACC6IEK6_9ACTN|nr:cyclase family protein [Nocardioides zeae]MDR6174218.1 kynurenine formamidase [Nocardioides zeae]MDR6209025.1 kynurenine formamidase [Nocardioides zeae]
MPTSDAAASLTLADLDELWEQCSTWGQWGPDDHLGALNHITRDVRARATGAVRSGRVVSCARALDTAAGPDNPHPAALRDVSRAPRPGVLSFAADELTVRCHGDVHSHIDALNHVRYGGTIWNHQDRDGARTAGGLEGYAEGIVTRGVLVDLPRAMDVDWLEPGTAVDGEQLAAAAEGLGIEPRCGDLLLVRTGHDARRAALGPWDAAQEKAGLHPRALPLLKQWQVAGLGSDGDGDTAPSPVQGVGAPVHVLGIHAMGLAFLDALDLRALAAACADEGRWDFLFLVAPLHVTGATGCAVNPLAMF